MLGDVSGLEKIYIVCGYTDMRKSIDGLCTVIEDPLKMDNFSMEIDDFNRYKRDDIWDKSKKRFADVNSDILHDHFNRM